MTFVAVLSMTMVPLGSLRRPWQRRISGHVTDLIFQRYNIAEHDGLAQRRGTESARTLSAADGRVNQVEIGPRFYRRHVAHERSDSMKKPANRLTVITCNTTSDRIRRAMLDALLASRVKFGANGPGRS